MSSGSLDKVQDYTDSRVRHWNQVADDGRGQSWFAKAYHDQILHTYRHLIPEGSKVLEIGCGDGRLLAGLKPSFGVGIDFSDRFVKLASEKFPDKSLQFHLGDAHDIQIKDDFDYIIVSDLVDDLWDVQSFFENLARQIGPNTKIVLNSYSLLWGVPLGAARRLGLATPLMRQNWLSPFDITNIADLGGLETVHSFSDVLFPAHVWGLTRLFNRYLVRLWPLNHLAFCNVYVLRARQISPGKDYTVSVIVPARNEAGNINEIIERVPKMGRATEIIFVEGGSQDDTLSTIKKEIASRKDSSIRVFVQEGRGKKNAVTKGFDKATGEILMILDADMTVRPEDLPKFYEALASGRGQFINGVRLSYPMEGEAMRPLNLIGNRFFSAFISWTLGQKLQDTLCGTKVLHRDDLAKITSDHASLGKLDPFGDFELIFGAAKLNLKIVNLPVRYQARTYGSTNISRWRHGLQLLKMVFVALMNFRFY